ncbi:MAG: acireductone synthase [Chromatiales bacterium 21-64-14]|nr:MAG: acireductone synthase [Chromatiales bacterium 21-64-14]HQU17098.1 acireductone synthase [Gammaproteobacteria bacterium]
MIRAVVTDIEGTTSSLSFVHRVLFPYARTRLAEFVAAHRDDPPVRAALDEARELLGGKPGDPEVVQAMLQWIDQDRKLGPLKTIQGMIWEDGYRRGDFTGHVYEDAVRHLRRWKAQGLDLYIFSSGSVQAQQLLFRHTPYGDLTPLFSGYFDTRTGPKREAAAYRAIAAAIGHSAGQTLFLSDVSEELDAAREAGMATVWLVRGHEPDPLATHPQAADFDAVEA